MGRAATAMLLTALAGCAAAPQWQREGGSPEELRFDLHMCQREAAIQAEQEYFGGRGGPRAPLVYVDPAKGDLRDSTAQTRRAATLAETSRRNELVRQCMHRLGYRQAPQ